MSKNTENTAIYVAFDDFRQRDPATPEKNLLRAILLSAMTDLKKRGQSGEEALQYFLNQDEDYIFSFRSVCAYLDIDAHRILKLAGLLNARHIPDYPAPRFRPRRRRHQHFSAEEERDTP